MASTARKPAIPAQVQGPRIAMLLAVLGLLLIGLLMVYSATSVELINNGSPAWQGARSQVIYAVIGVAAAVVVWRFLPYGIWAGWAVFGLWAVAMLLCIAVVFTGSDAYGAQRWLDLGFISLQPSEVAKPAILLMAVRILYLMRSGALEFGAFLFQSFVFVAAPVVLIYLTQSDLGTLIICAVGIYGVMWLSGISKKILGVVALIGVAFVLISIFGTGYRSNRMVYLDPWNDGQNGLGAGYNVIRSYYAFAEGGIFGVGLGNSHEKYQYLFASDNDFIFAVIGEELGMIGALVVIGLFLVVLVSGLLIANNASDELGGLMAGGLTIMLVFQAFLNMGCAIGVLPTTGKPLPFISAGGTSLIMSLVVVGIILSVSQAQSGPSVYEQRRSDLRVVRANRSDFTSRRTRPSRSGDAGPAAGLRRISVLRTAAPVAGARWQAPARSSKARAGFPDRSYDEFARIRMPRSARR